MKIESVKVQTLSVNLPRATGNPPGGKPITEVNPVLARVRAEDGTEGIGFCFVTNRQHLRILHAAVADLAELLVGEDPLRTTYLWQRLWASTTHVGHQGAPLYALAALDTAVWDLAAKIYGVPLYRLLGGFRDSVPVYASQGLWRTWTIDELQRDAADMVASGFRAVKMRVGDKPAEVEIERVNAVREAIGPGVNLMVDVNWAWDKSQAIRLGRRLEELGIYWLEDPVSVEATEHLPEIAQALAVPVCAGETISHKFGFRRLFENRSVDIAMIDLQRVGGVTEWTRVAALAQAWHLPVVSHLFWEIDVHLVASAPNGLLVEYMPWWEPMFRAGPKIIDGRVSLPARPGLGLELHEEAVSRMEIT